MTRRTVPSGLSRLGPVELENEVIVTKDTRADPKRYCKDLPMSVEFLKSLLGILLVVVRDEGEALGKASLGVAS